MTAPRISLSGISSGDQLNWQASCLCGWGTERPTATRRTRRKAAILRDARRHLVEHPDHLRVDLFAIVRQWVQVMKQDGGLE